MSRADDLELVAQFLDTLDERSFGSHGTEPAARRDELATPSALGAWLAGHGLAPHGLRSSHDDHLLALRLRAALRTLLATGDGADLNRVARGLPLVVRFAADGPVVEAAAGSAVTRFAAGVLARCAAAQARGDWSLLKMCAAPDCRCVFVDRSRNRLGRWCVSEVCGNRVKTRAYRARRRDRGSAA